VQLLHRFKSQPGLFVAKYLWIFANNLGILLKTGSIDQLLEVGNAILDKDYGLEASIQELCEDVLGSLSLVSMERQCMKRLMLLRRIFHALTNNTSGNQQGNLMNDILSTTIKQMFQELDMIAKGTHFNNNDFDHTNSYNYAKLSALQNAYSNLIITTASWLLKQISLEHMTSYQGYAQVLFDQLLFPSLQLGQSKQYLSNRYCENIVRFDFVPQLFGSDDNNSSLSLDLFNATNRHIRELVIYATNIENKDDRNTKFYGLMRSTYRTTQPNTKIIVNLLPALVSNIEHENFNGTSLSIAIDLYFSLVSMSVSNSIQEERLIQQFRSYAVNFFARNLSSKDNIKKLVMIDHLVEILDTASFRCKKKNESNFGIILDDSTDEGYLHFKDNICNIVYGLSSCIESSIHSLSESLLVMMKALVCLEHLLQIKIEGMEMLKWCQSKIHVNNYAKYVAIEMRFLYHLLKAVICIDKSKYEKLVEMDKENSKQFSPLADLESLSKSRQLLRKEMHLQGHMSMLPTNSVGLESIYQCKIDDSIIKFLNEFTNKYFYLSKIKL
jgi:hypothetical protein